MLYRIYVVLKTHHNNYLFKRRALSINNSILVAKDLKDVSLFLVIIHVGEKKTALL